VIVVGSEIRTALDKLPHGLDFAPWLARFAAPGAVIVSAAVEIPPGLDKLGDVQHSDTAVWVPIGGGAVGDEHVIVFTAVLSEAPYQVARGLRLITR